MWNGDFWEHCLGTSGSAKLPCIWNTRISEVRSGECVLFPFFVGGGSGFCSYLPKCLPSLPLCANSLFPKAILTFCVCFPSKESQNIWAILYLPSVLPLDMAESSLSIPFWKRRNWPEGDYVLLLMEADRTWVSWLSQVLSLPLYIVECVPCRLKLQLKPLKKCRPSSPCKSVQVLLMEV